MPNRSPESEAKKYPVWCRRLASDSQAVLRVLPDVIYIPRMYDIRVKRDGQTTPPLTPSNPHRLM